MATMTNEEIVRSLVTPFDGVDQKRLYSDDAAWQEVCDQIDPYVAADCLFVWVAPGARVERVGLDGFREQWLEWMHAFEAYRSVTEDVRALDDERVGVLVVQTGTMPGGADLPLQAAGLVFVRDGKVREVQFHASREILDE